ncbi:MAG: sodium-dependent transporter [Muribaculaceae bacterium]|nr:sodium-dependent transporter [Muribaculaceae bacterium]
MAQKAQFSSKIGLIAATVGSAVGLGNVWRFPAETQANGGAAFLLIYIGCVFLLGIPVMLAEFSLGRSTRSDAVGAFKAITPKKKWWLSGALAIIASYIILCFYMVVAGWTIEYLWQSITGNLYEGGQAGGAVDNAIFQSRMSEYIVDDINPLIFTYIVIIINIGILLCGVKKGIERLSNIMMPMLFLLLLVFAGVSLSLPNASEGLAFFLNPDFSKITPTVIVSALGQAFFSLSLGMGILITYSSYFPKDTKLTRTAITVSLLDLTVAFMMGVIIFPAVTSFGLEGESLNGATLIFITLPEIFTQLPGTQIWSVLFFSFLVIAAITSTISIAEVSIAFMQDRLKMSRPKACLTVLLPVFVLSSICSLSQGSLSHITIAGLNIFDFLDTLATNIMLPICSILICIYIGWVAPRNLMDKQLTNNGAMKSHVFGIVLFIVRYIAPILIAFILASQFFK